MKVCGVAVAMLPEYSWVPNWPIGTQGTWEPSVVALPVWASGPGGGQVRCRLPAAGGTEAP